MVTCANMCSVLQFMAGPHGDCLSLNHGGLGDDQNRLPANNQDSLDLQESGEQQLLNSQNYGSREGPQNVPNIILTGGCELARVRSSVNANSIINVSLCSKLLFFVQVNLRQVCPKRSPMPCLTSRGLRWTRSPWTTR